MLACKMPVSNASDGVITADYGSQNGMFGTFTLAMTAVVVPLTDSTTLIRLSGREEMKSGLTSKTTNTVTSSNIGRSGYAWRMFYNVAKQLHQDPAVGVDRVQSSPLVWIFAPEPGA